MPARGSLCTSCGLERLPFELQGFHAPFGLAGSCGQTVDEHIVGHAQTAARRGSRLVGGCPHDVCPLGVQRQSHLLLNIRWRHTGHLEIGTVHALATTVLAVLQHGRYHLVGRIQSRRGFGRFPHAFKLHVELDHGAHFVARIPPQVVTERALHAPQNAAIVRVAHVKQLASVDAIELGLVIRDDDVAVRAPMLGRARLPHQRGHGQRIRRNANVLVREEERQKVGAQPLRLRVQLHHVFVHLFHFQI